MTRQIPHKEMNDSSSNRGYIISVVILVALIVVGFFILIGSYSYFDKTVKEYHNAYQEDLSEKQTEIDDLEKTIEEYDEVLDTCIDTIESAANEMADYLLANCVYYMCKPPCETIEEIVAIDMCNDLFSGEVNLYDD